VRPAIVRASALALFAVLAGWTAIDLIRTAPPTGWVLGGALLALAGAAALQGTRRSQAAWHRASRAVLAIAFIGERLFAAGIDVIPMMGFLVLLIALASLQSLERTFGPVYDAVSDRVLLAKVDSAAVGAYGRALGLLAFTFIVSLLLALIVPLVALPSSSLFAAVGLAIGLLLVVAWLALSPSIPTRKHA